MKISRNNNVLIIDCGLLLPTYEINIAEVSGWEFVAEENGATYFSFKYSDSTQHVSIISSDADKLKLDIEAITEILKMEPGINICESRLSAADIIMGADSLSSILLATILLTTGSR